MSENEKTMTREELEKEIIKKAQADKEFKKALVGNPKETLKTQLGVQVPEDVEVKVVEESAKVVYLVLPFNPDELSDKQLDVISGGGCILCGGAVSYSVSVPTCMGLCSTWNS